MLRILLGHSKVDEEEKFLTEWFIATVRQTDFGPQADF